ncbi:MAG TPA: VWA domain-containing protein [Candidatus Binataceae bacterium]|nr:VWA domain-containing protein [Candidatus Binataceae bacterium]
MGFLNPINLVWAVALVILALIYLRSRSRPIISVSSLMLFDEVPAPVTRVRHVRIDPLFWLELAALTALVLAVGGLYAMVPAHAGRGRSHGLVFDLGAGMGARFDGRSGLEEAKKRALELVDRAPAGDEFSVITYALEAQVALPQTQNLDAVRNAIRALQPFAVAAHPSALSAAIMRGRGSSEIELFTDRAPPARTLGDAKGTTPLHLHQTAHGDDNVAIVSLDPGTVGSSRGRAVLRNFSNKPRLAEFQVKAEDREVFHNTLMFAPREQMVVPFGPLTTGGLISAHILTPDAIEADNQHWVYAPASQAGHALVLSADSAVRDDLARVLLAINPNLQIETADPAQFSLQKAGRPFDLAVMHDCYMPGISTASMLLIFPPPLVPPAARIPGLMVSAKNLPVILKPARDMPFSVEHSTVLPAVRGLTLPEWMDPLVQGTTPGGSDLAPLAAIGRIPSGRIGVIAFDVRDRLLLDADRLDALVVTINLIKQLTAPADIQVVTTGSYVDVPVAASAIVTAPDGSRSQAEADKWSRVRIRPLQSGHYALESGTRIVEIYANYFDASESDLAPTRAATLSPAPAPFAERSSSHGPRQVQPLLVVLAGLAMIAFVVESVVLIRHSTLWGTGHV